jgi:hypothetical protein
MYSGSQCAVMADGCIIPHGFPSSAGMSSDHLCSSSMHYANSQGNYLTYNP